MSPNPDIEVLLRQKQIMDQLNQVTSQGTGAAMLGGGANIGQFMDTSAAPQQQPSKGGGILSSMIPGLSQAHALKGSIEGGIQDKIASVFTPKDPSLHSLTYQQAQDPSLRPTLIRPPVQQPQINSAGQVMVGDQPQFTPIPRGYDPKLLGQ